MKIIFKPFVLLLTYIICVLLISSSAEAAGQIPVGQDVGAVERSLEEGERGKSLIDQLKKGERDAVIEERESIEPEIDQEIRADETKVLIETIVVEGATILTPMEVYSIICRYEGRELSLRDFRDAAEALTDQMRKKGYLTSVAYLPPQRIQNNTLVINMSEGIVGDINLKGNKYFKSNLILKYVQLESGDIFNYDILRTDINDINEHPDRSARVVLERGEGRAETDINIEVKDRFPWHVTLGYDNYNSRYVDRKKYSIELKSTNLLGFDDIASGEVQLGEAGRYQLYSGRYLLPLTRRLKLGVSYIHIDQKLGRSVSHLQIEGKGDVLTGYLLYTLIDTENLTVSISPAFDYKEIDNEVLGIVVSQDNMRVVKLGVDLDLADVFGGRTLVSQSFDYGLKDFLGGLSHKKDTRASRAGSGATFFRTVTNAARIQSMPYDASLVLKGAMQQSGYDLPSSEQFLIGGITTVRGYPDTEQSGDRGYTASAELYVPPYFLSKDLEVPFNDVTFYDSLRFVGFFDWGLVENKNPGVGESKREDIYSAGPAVRFNIPNKLSASFDYGFALGQDPTDGSHSRYYVEVKTFF